MTAERAHAAARDVAPLGILTAGGALPLDIAAAVVAGGRPVHLVALEGFAGAGVAAFPHDRASMGQISRILNAFRRAGCREVVIAGALQRPDYTRLRFDLGFFRHLPTALSITRGGDDSVLRRVIRIFESEGFIVRGVGEVAPHLVAGSGRLGRLPPDPGFEAAAARAERLMAALGAFDVGQAIVATADRIVAIEGVLGTDALLGTVGPDGIAPGLGKGGVLVKLAKPGQELRIDLPTIGPVTVERAAAAGLAGIAVSAGASIIMDEARTLAAADAAGLMLAGRPFVARADGAARAADPDAEAKPLAVLARRAPTPAERRDIGIGRHLIRTLATADAGRAAVIAGEHVLCVAGALPIAPLIRPLGLRRHWGLRALRGRIGVLALDLSPAAAHRSAALPTLDRALFEAVRDARLAGIACFGGPVPEAERADAIAWANEAKVFLMAEALPP